VVKKPDEYIDSKALPQFYKKFLQPAHLLNTEQERFAAATAAIEQCKESRLAENGEPCFEEHVNSEEVVFNDDFISSKQDRETSLI